MKIEIELPDWARERRLLILAGVELVAEKEPWNDYWEVKEQRCNHCGQCCFTLTPNSKETPFGVDDEGRCKALIDEGDKWMCGAGTKRPYNCLHDPLKANTPECCITRIRVDV